MELSNFTRNLTAEASEGLIDPPIGRDKIINELLRILSQEGKSNILITGSAGTGKTNIVEGLAYWISNHKVPQGFPKNEVIELNITQLNSGAIYVGQFEERVTKFLNDVVERQGVVVFIDEIHMIMGFGATSSSNASRDFSQIIKPYLARGTISVIGATTTEEYKRYIEHDSAFTRRFELLDLPELDQESVFQILKRIIVKYKTKGLNFTDKTLTNVIDISNQVFPSRFQPDKAIDIIKKIARNYDGQISKSSPKKSTDFTEYISHLNYQLKLIEAEDFPQLTKRTKSWLGVNTEKTVIADLSSEEIKQMIKNK